MPSGTSVEFGFSADGRRLLTSNDSGLAQLWDLETGREIGRAAGPRSPAAGVRLCDGGRTGVAVSADGVVRLWNTDGGAPIGWFGGSGSGRLLSWDVPENARALLTARLTGPRSEELLVWRLDRPDARRHLEEQLAQARRRLQVDSNDADALETVGEWLAFRGVDGLATSILERARRPQPPTSLTLARCYWKVGRSGKRACPNSAVQRRLGRLHRSVPERD